MFHDRGEFKVLFNRIGQLKKTILYNQTCLNKVNNTLGKLVEKKVEIIIKKGKNQIEIEDPLLAFEKSC